VQEPQPRWVPRDRRQVEIYRLMGLFGPVVAAFYGDACRLLDNDSPLVSTTHLVGHLLRELESAVREVLRPMIPAKRAASLFTKCGECGRVGGDHKGEIDEIANALGFPPGDEVRSLWKSLRLHRIGHRGSQLGPRPVSDDFRVWWDGVQVLLLRLGRQFESSFTVSLPLIDELAAKEKPDGGDVKKLGGVPHSVVALERFFTRAGSGWFPLLRKKGYLSDPPPLEVADDTVAYVRWPAGLYLARMAAEPSIQRDVIEVAFALETNNPQAHECAVEAALALPVADGARLAPKIASFLATPYQWALPPKVRDLIARLASAGQPDAALLLLRRLVETETGRGGWRVIGLVPELVPAVFPQLGLNGLALLADLLDEALDERIPGGRTWRDNSYGWRRALDGGPDHDQRQVLTTALRDAAVLVASTDPKGVAAVVGMLERRERAIFHRLALHVLQHVPDERLIGERIGRRELFADFYVDREYTLLVREHWASLPSEIQARVLEWIDAGPPQSGLEAEAIDRWRLGQLARFGDALPADQASRYQRLVERFGEHTEAEIEGRFGDIAPSSVEELLALPDEEIVALLRSWQPQPGLFAPSREGLQQQLQKAAAHAHERFAAIAPAFADLHPAYAVGVLSGLGEAAEQGRTYEWRPVFDLAHVIIGKPRMVPDLNEHPEYEVIRGWADVRMEIARLLGTGLRHDRIPVEGDSDVFDILAALAADPDPSPADEQRLAEANTGPVTLDLNTVRGTAFHALMQYAWWHKKQTPPGQTSSLGRPLRELLDRHLDSEHEPTQVIRSIYGQYFPCLLACDGRWARSRVDAIFPRDLSLGYLRHAAWDRYLLFNHPSRSTYELLGERYREAITQLSEENLEQAPGQLDHETTEALTRHVFALYAQGTIGLEPGSPVDIFFARAPVGARAHVIEMTGIEVTNAEQPSPAALERLQRLWQWRIGVLQQHVGASLEELKGFGWWFASGKFDDDWALGQLYDLLVSDGAVESDHMVVERLAALRRERLAQVVTCLSLLIDAMYRDEPQRSWLIMAARDDIRVILTEGMAAEEAKTSRVACETVNRLIARGHTEFADLLS
jgi:hypothetical protein